MTIPMIVLVDQFMVHSMAKIHPVIKQLINRSHPLIPLNIKQDDLEQILQLIKFTPWKVYLNRRIILMLS